MADTTTAAQGDDATLAAVLVIDPDPATLDFAVRTLAHAGYRPSAFMDLDPRNGSLDRLSADPPVQVAVVDARALDPLEDGPPMPTALAAAPSPSRRTPRPRRSRQTPMHPRER